MGMHGEWTRTKQDHTRTPGNEMETAGMNKKSSRSLGMDKEWTRNPPGIVGECKVLVVSWHYLIWKSLLHSLNADSTPYSGH